MSAARFVLPLFALGLLSGPAATIQAAAPWPWSPYQPYGIQTGTTTRTPPHFAVHPPVYYGSRYARPYGVSPFATLPQVASPDAYQSRLYSENVPMPETQVCPHCAANGSAPAAEVHTAGERSGEPGPIRENPHVNEDPRVAEGA